MLLNMSGLSRRIGAINRRKNIVSLLRTRVPGLESGKACTIRLPPLEGLQSRMLLKCGTQRVRQDFLRVVDTVLC